MALIVGTVALFDRLHVDGEYFRAETDFGFKASVTVPVTIEHELAGYVFKHAAVLMRLADGLHMLHPLDETLPDERAMLERIKAGGIYLSPGPVAPGHGQTVARAVPTSGGRPRPLTRYIIREVAYTTMPAQSLPAVKSIL